MAEKNNPQKTAFKKRPLGKSGMEITTVGLGTWAIGGGGWSFGWGPQDDNDSIGAIRHGVELGINWVDTAAVYGFGHSEEMVGRAIKDIPAKERPYIFTKCGMVFDPAKRFDPPRQSLRPESIRRECEASLHRLGVERIDLYQFHWPDGSTPIADSWGEMGRLIEEGKVRAGGVSNFSVPQLEELEQAQRAKRLPHLGSLQPPFSMIRRNSAADVIPWCAAHETGVIVYSPMQAGLLTEKMTAERVAKFPEDDWRRRTPEFQEPNLSRNLKLRDALRPIAERHRASDAEIAMAWVLSWPGVTGAIAGARSAAQVDGWIRAGQIALTAQELDEIARLIGQTGAGSGPTRAGTAQAAAN
jgi:aryl-alcohol dehydrogenase-like predicted oxidoreductase